MSDQIGVVSVNILDRDYSVNCPSESKTDLAKAAYHLDKRMREIRRQGRVVGTERIAVMAALNITYEMLTTAGSSFVDDAAVEKMCAKIEQVLSDLPDSDIEDTLALTTLPENEAV